MSSWKAEYPKRYYAYSNTSYTLGGYPTVGWVDVDIFTDKPSWLPVASDMISLTADEWENRSAADQIIENGAIVTYTAPATTT